MTQYNRIYATTCEEADDEGSIRRKTRFSLGVMDVLRRSDTTSNHRRKYYQ
jgi:hypothetical protein